MAILHCFDKLPPPLPLNNILDSKELFLIYTSFFFPFMSSSVHTLRHLSHYLSI